MAASPGSSSAAGMRPHRTSGPANTQQTPTRALNIRVFRIFLFPLWNLGGLPHFSCFLPVGDFVASIEPHASKINVDAWARRQNHGLDRDDDRWVISAAAREIGSCPGCGARSLNPERMFPSCSLFIEMEGLWIEFSGKSLDPFSARSRTRPDPKVCPTAKSSKYRPLIRIQAPVLLHRGLSLSRIFIRRLVRRASRGACVDEGHDRNGGYDGAG